jgi:hypothetical protein
MTPFRLSIFFFIVYICSTIGAGLVAFVIDTYAGFSLPNSATGIAALAISSILAGHRYIRHSDTAPSSRTMWGLSFYLSIAAAFALALLLPVALLGASDGLLDEPGIVTIFAIVLILAAIVQFLMIRVFFGMGVKQELTKMQKDKIGRF